MKFMKSKLIKLPKNKVRVIKENDSYNLFIEKIVGYEIMDEFGKGSKPLYAFEGAFFSEFRSLVYYLIFNPNRAKKKSKIVELTGLTISEEKSVREIL